MVLSPFCHALSFKILEYIAHNKLTHFNPMLLLPELHSGEFASCYT